MFLNFPTWLELLKYRAHFLANMLQVAVPGRESAAYSSFWHLCDLEVRAKAPLGHTTPDLLPKRNGTITLSDLRQESRFACSGKCTGYGMMAGNPAKANLQAL